MTIRWTLLPFDALPLLILYDVLRLRAEIFVVEQNCPYQDIDRRDVDALHLLGYNEQGELAAYARLFDAGQCYEQASIGRVVAQLPADARKRLSTLEEFSDLGAGFNVAMRDLDIRGAGNLLGGEQSGFINDLGYETYHQILDEAVQELKETEFRDLFLGDSNQRLQLAAGAGRSHECNVETDQQVLIPEKYVSNVSERLQLYAKLDRAQKPEELRKLLGSMVDRFGPLPPEVEQLADIVRLRWQACKVGFSKITLKRDTLKGFLPADEDHKAYFQGEQFGTILNYVQTHSRTANLKEKKDQLIVTFEEVRSIQQAKRVLSELGSEEAVAA